MCNFVAVWQSRSCCKLFISNAFAKLKIPYVFWDLCTETLSWFFSFPLHRIFCNNSSVEMTWKSISRYNGEYHISPPTLPIIDAVSWTLWSPLLSCLFYEPFSFFLLFMEILLLLLRTFVSCFVLTTVVAILNSSPLPFMLWVFCASQLGYYCTHCNGNSVYIFLFWELRGLSPNVHIHISSSRKGRPIVEIYNSFTDTWT